VLDARFTADGQTLVAAVRDGRILAYDTATGVQRTLGRTRSEPDVLAIAPGANVAITGTMLGEVVAWPLDGGPSRMLVGGGRAVTAVRFDGSGKRFVVDRETGPSDVVTLAGEVGSIGPDAALRVVVAQHDYAHAAALATPHQIVEVGSGRTIARSDKSIEYLALSPYGDTLVFHDGDTVWQVPFSGGTPTALAPYPGTLNAVTWSPDCNSVAITGHLPNVSIVDLSSNETRELHGHTDQVYTAEFSRDGKTLLTAGDDGTARIWDVASGTSRVLRGHDDDVYRAHFSPDERSVATSSLDGSARLWSIDARDAREARVLDEGKPILTLDLAHDHVLVRTAESLARWDLATGARDQLATWGAYGGDPSPDGEHVAVKLPDLSIEVRGKDDASPEVVLRGHKALVSRVVWSDDGLAVYSSSFDGTLRRWDPTTGAEQGVMWAGDEPVRFFVIAPDGRLAARVGDKLVLIGADGKSTTTGICPLSMRFEQVRGRLVVQRCDHQLVLIDGDRQIELATNGNAVARFAVSPTGGFIAAAMGNRAIIVWDDRGHRVAELRGHTDLVLDVAFSPDGKRLASAAYDKTIRVWDLATEHSRVLRGHTGPVERVVWRNPEELVSASDDGTVRVWQAPPTELPTAAEIARMLDAATSAAIDQRDRPTTLTRW
jgi:WD40 repeat protein